MNTAAPVPGSLPSSCHLVLGGLLCLALVSTAQAGDSGGYRGPNRCGVHPSPALVTNWPAAGPPLLWRYPRRDEDAWKEEETLGTGWSNVSVKDDTVYVAGMRYDAGEKNLYGFAFGLDGELKWVTKLTKDLACGRFEGPRATPECVDGRVYFTSGRAEIFCLDAKDGKLIWGVDTRAPDFGNKIAGWGHNLSPLIADGKVITPIRRGKYAMIALDAVTGKLVWGTPEYPDCATVDSSPVLLEVAGKRFVLQNMYREVIAVSLATGELAWKLPGKMSTMLTPVVAGGHVFLDLDGKLVQVEPKLAAGKLAFETVRDFGAGGGLGQIVVMNGRLYRLSASAVQCLDLKTGAVLAAVPGKLTPRSLIAADGKLFSIATNNRSPGNGKGLYRDEGLIHMFAPTPAGLEELGVFKPAIGTKEIYVAPVIAEGRLFHRHGTTLAVYDLRPPPTAKE